MKKIMVILMLAGLVLLSNVCYAQSGKEAVRSLQKLQAKVEVGINYRDYTSALGDALFEVKLFLKSSEAKDKPELTKAINNCMAYFISASKFFGLYGSYKNIHQISSITGELYKTLLDVYPDLPIQADYTGRFIDTELAMQYFWNKAKTELDLAIGFL